MMERSGLHMTALVAFSLALGGCATVSATKEQPKDATILSANGAAPKAPVQQAEPLPAIDLDGALRQAVAQRKAGDLTGATHTLSQLVLAAPDDSRVLGEYGKTLVAMGRSDDALAFLERAIELQPSDWSLFSARGVAFDQEGKYTDAQISYDRALSLKPGDPAVLSNEALSRMQAGDLDGAERLLLQAKDAGGDYPRVASNLALIQSLKAAKQQSTAQSAPVIVQTPPQPAPPPVAASMPQPEATATPRSVIVNSNVQQMTLPEPETATDVDDSGDGGVIVQKVPADKLAGPYEPKRTAAVKKPVANKKAVADGKPRSNRPLLLRPALSDSPPAKEASVSQ